MAEVYAKTGEHTTPQTFCFTEDGLGADDDLAQDFSVTPANYEIRPASGLFTLQHIAFDIRFGTTPIDYSEFGDLTALTNGINIFFVEPDGTTHAYNSIPIKNNGHLMERAEQHYVGAQGVAGTMIVARWSLYPASNTGDGVQLRADGGIAACRLVLSDDLSGLDYFHVLGAGFRMGRP